MRISASDVSEAGGGRRLSDRFARAAGACATQAELRALLNDVVPALGFQYFALIDHSTGAGSGRATRIDNYPPRWAEEWLAQHATDDPVHVASRRTNMGFAWSQLPSLVSLEQRHRRILDCARFHGLGGGFTVPANVPGEPSASCSFAVAPGRELPNERLCSAELVGVHALCAARRLRPVSPPVQRPRLSRREVQCLALVAAGKTDWEIAHILGLSPHTARYYVKRLRTAYDTVSRAQLVAYGLRDSWIGFDDAIPPNGRIG